MSDEETMVEVAKTEDVLEAAAPEVVQPTMADVIRDPNAPIITVKKLLEVGVHFGHQTRRWNPKMGKFIYGARNGIYIIDLTKTVNQVNAAYKKLKSIVDEGGKVLFVGTKESAKEVVVTAAVRSGSFYISNRWLGGTLTNFRTILSRIKRLKDLQLMQEDGSFDKLPKKEVAVLHKELEKLARNLEGVKEMRRTPQAIVIDDPTLEHNAIAEAKKLGIPTFAIVDTNDDPDLVDYPIPSNNDGSNALRLLLETMADAIVESKGGITEYAYIKEEGEEATMKDAIRSADLANEARKAAMRAQRAEREERYKRMQNDRTSRYSKRDGGRPQDAPKAEQEKPAEVKAPVESAPKDESKKA